MNKSRRKLVLIFSIFFGVMLAAATSVIAYFVRQMLLAEGEVMPSQRRFGDIFDRVACEQTQAWVIPTLIVIVGVSLIGFFVFIGLFIYRSKEAADA